MQMKMKSSILCGVGLLGLASVAQAELTANVGVTSNYVFRGETATDDGPAVQGGVDFLHETGLYAGAWASNVETAGGDSGFETDLYAGYEFKLNENVKFDVGYITYKYHSIAGNPDSDELYFGASFKDVSVTYYDGDRDAGSDYSYIDLKYTIVLQNDFNLHLHYGNKNDDGGGDYEDASIGISKQVSGFDLSLTVTTIDYDNGNIKDETEAFVTAIKKFDLAF